VIKRKIKKWREDFSATVACGEIVAIALRLRCHRNNSIGAGVKGAEKAHSQCVVAAIIMVRMCREYL
jgi:hypothetical protein